MRGRIEYLDVNGNFGTIPIWNYPSGEPMIQFDSVPNAPIHRIMVRPLNMMEFMAAMFFADALRERGQWTCELVIPFIPGARQDRLNGSGDYLFTAKSIAHEINARKFSKVTIVDPHSDVIASLVDRCRVYGADDVIHASSVYPFVSHTAVVSPDAGAEKRAGKVAKLLGVPLIHGWKTRDVNTGKLKGFGLEGSTIAGPLLVVDDICDGGGTFLGLADVINARGLQADLYVTHGIFSNAENTAKLLDSYGKVICTDSINFNKLDRPGIEVINVCSRIFHQEFVNES